MNRRDFFLLRTEGNERVLELSCETLYMHYTDGQIAASIGAAEEGSFAGAEWWAGEPPAQRNAIDSNDIFADLERELATVNKVSVLDSSWLVSGEFRNKVEAVLFAFCERGGQLEFENNQNTKKTVTAV